jgi:hypothetical protein
LASDRNAGRSPRIYAFFCQWGRGGGGARAEKHCNSMCRCRYHKQQWLIFTTN